MNRFALLVMLTISVLAFSPVTPLAQASSEQGVVEGGGHGESVSVIAGAKEGIIPGVTAIVIFVVALGVLSTMVWPKIVAGLDERNEKIMGEIAAAEDARRQAKESLEQYEQNLAQARDESQKMLEETRAQQSKLAAQLKASADKELGEMREKALNEIEAAKKQALGEIYNESVNLASVMAGKILQRQVTADDQQRLMDESIAEMKTVG